MAGAMCPEQLLLDLKKDLNCEVFVAYGTTENSPVTTLSTQSDSLNQKTTTVGAVMPHTECKIIDTASGGIVERGNDFTIFDILKSVALLQSSSIRIIILIVLVSEGPLSIIKIKDYWGSDFFDVRL